MRTQHPRYEHTGPILVRASTDPAGLAPPEHLDLADDSALLTDGRAWLDKLWSRPEVRDAIGMASPALTRRLDDLTTDTRTPRAKELRGPVTSMVGYVLRWQRRATPFGLFAGIGTAHRGGTRARFGDQHDVLVRADAEWAAAVTDQLEADRAVRTRLTVVADNTHQIRDGRVVVLRRAELGSATPGPVRESSVRATRPVRIVLGAATAPIPFTDLAEMLRVRFPRASAATIEDLLHSLIDAGVLITNLRAPSTVLDPLTHLHRALTGEYLSAAGVEPVRSWLDSIHDAATRPEPTGITEQRAARDHLAATMSTPPPQVNAPAGSPLVADVRLHAEIAVPEAVLTEAETAASMLVRTSTQPFGSTAWLDYHSRFRARYGPGALVPVRELISDAGLGYPTGFLGAPRAHPSWRMLTERDAALLALIQRAGCDGAEEIQLGDTDIDALTIGDHSDTTPPRRIELGFAVEAASTDAVDRGDFRLRVTGTPRTASTMTGRFAYLLPPAERHALAATFTDQAGPIPAQLAFLPRRPHNENVTRVPPLLPTVVSLGEHPGPPEAVAGVEVIGVGDLAVTADTEHLYLIQRSTGRQIDPRFPHALDTTVQAPPLARFLAEITDARAAQFRGFDLGAARTLPWIPRIRYRRTVLHPARWLLHSTDLAHSAGYTELREWANRHRVPERVVLVRGELRLPLRLDHALDRSILLTHLRKSDRIELHDDGPPTGNGWSNDRPTEFLISLRTTAPTRRSAPPTSPPGAVLAPGATDLVHAQFTGNPARFDDILTGHLPRVIAELGELVRCWWISRHRDLARPDTDQHLALFLRLHTPAHYGLVATRLAVFADELREHGLPGTLTLATTYRQPGRYGSRAVLALAERVFATDTAAAVAQLDLAHHSDIPAQALAAASMTRLAATFAPDTTTGHQALLDRVPQRHGPLDATVREHALRLTENPAHREIGEPTARLTETWHARDTALRDYHRALLAAHRDPAELLTVLVHEHHVRAIGPDPDTEKETTRIARICAQRAVATRTRAATP